MLKLTVDQQEQFEAESQQQAEEHRNRLEQAARLEAVGKGPLTLGERLAEVAQSDERIMQRLKRIEREKEAIRRHSQNAQAALDRQKAVLEADRTAFQQFIDQRQKQLQDEDFQRAVRMYEQIKPKQAKQMFQRLIREGKITQVVDYLAAMQQRKAAAVLGQFKADQDIFEATMLVQKLRERGEYTEAGQTKPVGNPGGGNPA